MKFFDLSAPRDLPLKVILYKGPFDLADSIPVAFKINDAEINVDIKESCKSNWLNNMSVSELKQLCATL